MKGFTILTFCLLSFATSAFAQTNDDASIPPESEVRGGIYDKPFMFEVGGTKFGGYTDLQYRLEREEGFTTDATFLAKQVNLFFFAPLHEIVRFTSELEIEDGGEEIVLELAILDFDIAPVLSLRMGMLLTPIGRFNVAHDSPANDFVDRPLVATAVIPTTMSEPGAGAFGGFAPWEGARVSYEAYAVNGFNEGLVTEPAGDSPLEGGKSNLVDNNLFPSLVGRLGFSPIAAWEVAVSAHSGPYNRWRAEGLPLDVRRDVTIVAVDTELRISEFELRGEAAHVRVDLPDGLLGLRGERFGGLYAEVLGHFGRGLIPLLPQSVFTGGLRYGFVDHDLEVAGGHVHRGTVGLNFRPIEDVAFKADYQRDFAVDRDGNAANAAAVLFAGAAYF